MQTSNEQVMRRFVVEVLNATNFAALGELVHQEYVYRSPGEELRGQEGLAALLNGYRSAFPGLKVQVDELLAFDNAMLLSYTLTGTHRGEFLGNPATGRSVKIHGMVRSLFREGKIAEESELLDQLALFEQLGLIRSGS